jgi:universal stress protein A
MAIPFQKILCPVDFEQNSLLALEFGAKLAEHENAMVYVLHVVSLPTVLPKQPEPWKDWERIAKARLDEIATEKLPNVRFDTKVVTGDAAAEIVKTADDLQADLIVMATHARSGMPRLLMGSVTEHVLKESRCPVTVIRPSMDN